jgi:hypothetical protein
MILLNRSSDLALRSRQSGAVFYLVTSLADIEHMRWEDLASDQSDHLASGSQRLELFAPRFSSFRVPRRWVFFKANLDFFKTQKPSFAIQVF